MPEGHTIHRFARLHGEELQGCRMAAWSPQGRFADGAAVLNGRVLTGVDAHGKHLFYRWEGAVCLHIHLGLFGTLRTYHGDAPQPSAATRLALHTDRAETPATIYLAGPAACELIDPGREEILRARLGPDPLSGADGLPAFRQHLRSRRATIAQVLLDQRVVAGIGNAYRAEALFLCGMRPDRPAHDLSDGEVAALWDTLCRLLTEGERTGQIDTVTEETDQDDYPARYVYRRDGEPCRRCGTLIDRRVSAGRALFACPTCQRG